MSIFAKSELEIFRAAFVRTIPVLLGYLAIGIPFGLLLVHAGYDWWLAPVMSLLIYAGAGQYVAVSLLVSQVGLWQMAMVTLMVNCRHMVYGLSLLKRFEGVGRFYPYLVFSLTDETYALLTTVSVPEGVDKGRFYFYLALLDHFYWIVGSLIGAVLGRCLSWNTEGLDFALTALFVVLLLEQIKHCRSRMPFVIAGVCGLLSLLLVPSSDMLIVAIVSSILLLLLCRRLLPNER
jgi:4-azaleucine resistance transporter AzlC